MFLNLKPGRMKVGRIITLIMLSLLASGISSFSQKTSLIVHDKVNKTVTLSDSGRNLLLRLNYSGGCILDKVIVNGTEVTGNGNSVFSGIRYSDKLLSSRQCTVTPVITIIGNSVVVDSMKYGNNEFSVAEKWIFKIAGKEITWQINRQYLNEGIIDDNYFPCWQFNSINTWDGAMLDNGGVAWNRFVSESGETYGTHAAALTFWNRINNSCMRINPDADQKVFRTVTFSHQPDNVLSVAQSSSTDTMKTRNGLRRFVTNNQSVFVPIKISKSCISILYTLQALTYDQEYDRGELKGVSEKSVNEMLNTIGRYGVVDENLYGSNGWRTGWTVLQEPWLALFGLAIDSPDFINGFSQTLEYERENAIISNGRVLPRWHHDSTDAMPNTFRNNGFYECKWGYMFDSQPAFAIDVAEQFDMTGDLNWLRKFKPACEKVLDFMIKRDSDGNGLFEVAENTHKAQKGTDWMDVVWASYEVASINAYMYRALTLWSDLENLLGDKNMAEEYRNLAFKLKTSFNKDVANGGFWNPEKGWYVYWREKDGSIYGNNLVSMVNFLAIGYGICDNQVRKNDILSKMEELMQKENLFIWPSCFFPYEDNMGLENVNYPYPNYENGDLFLAWAELGTRCYAEKNPEIALKYIQNVIKKYELDGLAYQRYSRVSQTGKGDDILSNNVMAIVGLYRNIYGIRPRYDRLYIEPHLTPELNGTKINYWLRDQDYVIELTKEKYSIYVNDFSVSNKYPFAVNSKGGKLEYFNGEDDRLSLLISDKTPCSIEIVVWGKNNRSWNEIINIPGKEVHHELHNLNANAAYQLIVDGVPQKKYIADASGIIRFDYYLENKSIKIQMLAVDPNNN